MVVGEVATGTDVLVVGGGPGGYTAALRAADLGRSVTLVERHRLGGVCLNVGCIPSKALIESAHLAGLPARAARTGVALTAAVDMAETQRWISGVVEGLTADVDGLLRRAGVTVVRGDAHFGASRRVAVTHDKGGTATSFFEYQSAVVATGSRPMALPGVPFDGVRVLDSTAALALTELPTEMVVVGGGYIGVELGGAFAKLGVGVTIVEMADRLLPGMPASLAAVLERALVAGGVRVRPGTKVLGLDGDRLAVCAREGGSEETLAAPVVVVAVGREPNTAGMGLEATGAAVDPASGLIDVDPSRRAARGVYAIGDVTAGPALAHKATAEAEVAARACAGLRAAFDPSVIP
ncbi:MAG: FAD-dependent oxidoreductase, partial [Acidimicrobiia bacterium]